MKGLRKRPFVRRILYVLALIFAAFLLLGLRAFWWEPASLQIVRQTVSLRPWHPEHSGIKIAVLSDIHAGAPHMSLDRLKRVVDAANAEKPDLVVMLGDFVIQDVVGGTFIYPEPIAFELGKLRAPLGVVTVLGNHDWWFDGPRIRTAMEANGIRVLEGEILSITHRGKTFRLAGAPDLLTRGGRIPAMLQSIPSDEPVILLTHNPDIFPQVPAHVSLTLAGHTHGGQVDFPFLGRLVVPSQFGARYAHGLVEESGKKLFVTSGIGTSIFPVRFRVPPEIVVLTLS